MARRSFFTILLFFSISFSKGQEVKPMTQLDFDISKAQKTFDAKKYNTAAGLYQRLYKQVKNEEQKQKMLFMIAESFRKSNNFKKAFDWYEKLVNEKYPDPKVIYSYGLLLKNFEKYDEAARTFYDYLFEVPNDPDGIREMNSCNIVQTWKANPGKFTVKNVDELNTLYSDYSPFYTYEKLFWSSSRPEATGNEIFEWTGQKCSDIFESNKSINTFGKPVNVKGLVNTNSNEGVAWIDSANTTMYYTLCNGTDGKGLNCKIYVSYFQNNSWIAPRVLPFCSDSFSCGHPAMSADGKRMFFASDLPGGFGEKDIYFINYNPVTDKWGKPVNLGKQVNSKEDDMFPFVDENDVIYFSSKGRTGMGGLDIFRTRDSAGTFSVAENLQYPVNSGGDDFGITFVPKNQLKKITDPVAYFCSNREGGKGDDDIYSITVKPYIFIVKGKVFDKEMNTVMADANVGLTDSSGRLVFSIKSNAKGEFAAELPLNNKLNLFATVPKYFRSSDKSISSLNISKDSTLEVNIFLDPMPSEEIDFTLQGIYYDVDKWFLRDESKRILDSLIIILNKNPGMVIELGSHTDSRAAADYNIKLSQKRAESCVNYLVEHSITRDRLVPVGYGETRLVNDCADGVDCTDEQHQQNRRTTFRILKTDYKKKR